MTRPTLQSDPEVRERQVTTPMAPHEPLPWAVYEAKKAELEAACLPAGEYEERLARLVAELCL